MSDIDTIRLLAGDADASDQVLDDSDIQTLIEMRSVVDSTGGTTTNVVAAAADAAGAIAAHYSRQFDFSEDGQGFSRAQRVGQYQGIERDLRQRAGGQSAALTLAGTATT